MKRVAFRTGGGALVGLGHVRRCLALADALHALGTESMFLLDGEPVLVEEVAAAGFKAVGIRPEQDLADTIEQSRAHRAGVVVVDSYALGTAYLRDLSEATTVVVLDDLADRELPVALVVNGSAGAEDLPYRGASHTRCLLGPRYIPLRGEFAGPPGRDFDGEVRRVLVTVGGSDPRGLTTRLIQWVAETLGAVAQDVVVGPWFDDREGLRAGARGVTGPVRFLENPRDMRSLMLGADLAISGGGQTTYELAATGTPAIGIRMADNQTVTLKGLSEAGALLWAGDAEDADLESRVRRAIESLAAAAGRLREMSRRGRVLVDGRGAARVAHTIVDLLGERG